MSKHLQQKQLGHSFFPGAQIIYLLVLFAFPVMANAQTAVSKTNWVLETSYSLSQIRDMVRIENRLFCLQNLQGMTEFKIGETGQLTTRSIYSPEELNPIWIQPKEDHLYMVDRFRGLVIWKLEPDGSLTSVSTLLVPGIAQHVALAEVDGKSYAALACSGEGLVLVDVSIPSEPKIVDHHHWPVDFTRRIASSGKYLFVADHMDGGLKTFIINPGGDLYPDQQINFAGFCEDVICDGEFLYCGFRTSGFRIFQWKPNAEREGLDVTFLSGASLSHSLIKRLNYYPDLGLVASNETNGLSIYDVSNKSFPVLTSELWFDGSEGKAQASLYYRGRMYVAAWDGVLVYKQEQKIENAD